MKAVITLLFCLISSTIVAQVMFRMKMTVIENNQDIQICIQDTDVIWGTYLDTLGILYNDKIVKLYSYQSKDLEGKSSRLKELVRAEESKSESQEEYNLILRDRYNEFYQVRILQYDGVLIFINNLEYKYPSLLLCFGKRCPVCN